MTHELQCAAQVWAGRRCTKSATHEVRGVLLCGTHYRQFARNGRVVLEDRVLRLEASAP